MNKRGDISLSFGMIFSIILIISILAVAGYAVMYFIDLKDCTTIGLFYRDIQGEVDDAWQSDTVRDSFTGAVPGDITRVCFGNLSEGKALPEYNLLRLYAGKNASIFFYPPAKACDTPYAQLPHSTINGFFCLPVVKGKVTVNFVKNTYDRLVTVCNPADGPCESIEDSAPAPEPLPELNPVTQAVCQRASEGGICDGLILVYGSSYKIKCCSQHTLCC